MMFKNTVFITLMLCILFSVAGCGKRPDVVDAPDGADPKAFPRTYPDVSTDPK